MSITNSNLAMQCNLNTDLLSLAVHLARRDVARLRSPTDLVVQSSRGLIKPSEYGYSVMAQSSGPPASESSVIVPKKSAPPSTSTVKSRKTGLLSDQIRSGELESHDDPAGDLPVRGMSPPTRDTDHPVPNPSRTLHEPTEKQLQSAWDSHMRQLRAKIDRYSAAMAELRLQTQSQPKKDITAREGGGNARNNSIGNYTLQPRGRPQIRGRFRPIPKAKVRSAVVRQEVVPLRQRSRVIRTTQAQKMHQPGGKVSDSEFSGDHNHSDEITKRMNEQVNTLWEQTLRALRSRDSELIELEPDSQSDLVPDWYPHSVRFPVQFDGRNVEREISLPPPTESPLPNTDCHCPHPGDDISSTDFSLSGLNAPGLLRAIDQAESEEAEIRRRWAHLSVKQTDSSIASEAGATKPPQSASSSHLHSSPSVKQGTKEASTTPVAECHGLVFHSGKQVESQDLRFLAFHSTAQQSSNPLGNTNKDASTGLYRIPLRLPTGLHRAILINAYESKQSKEKQKKHNLLTSASAKSLSLVRVCEWISDELVNQVISDVAENLEHEMSCLVDALVDGELYSEDPDSISLTGKASLCPSVDGSVLNSKPESSTHASGSLDSTERFSGPASSSKTSQNALSSREIQCTESRQNNSCTSASKIKPGSACPLEHSYTFQFDQISVDEDSLSQSSSANLGAQSNCLDNARNSEDLSSVGS